MAEEGTIARTLPSEIAGTLGGDERNEDGWAHPRVSIYPGEITGVHCEESREIVIVGYAYGSHERSLYRSVALERGRPHHVGTQSL